MLRLGRSHSGQDPRPPGHADRNPIGGRCGRSRRWPLGPTHTQHNRTSACLERLCDVGDMSSKMVPCHHRRRWRQPRRRTPSPALPGDCLDHHLHPVLAAHTCRRSPRHRRTNNTRPARSEIGSITDAHAEVEQNIRHPPGSGAMTAELDSYGLGFSATATYFRGRYGSEGWGFESLQAHSSNVLHRNQFDR